MSWFIPLFIPRLCLTMVSLLACGIVHAEPWGKDADLCRRVCSTTKTIACPSGVGVKISEILIGFHQNVVSPADGPRSHFIPSSSQYTMDAIRKYGFFQGYVLGCDRLMRENPDPWVYRKTCNSIGTPMKWDPVP